MSDHKAEAERLIAHATDESAMPWELVDETERWVITATIAEAQVHATLAVAEALRGAS